MARKSWVLSDEFWAQAEPLIPVPRRDPGKEYVRIVGGGRKRVENRRILSGIFYVLRTGCHWNAVPGQFGSSSTIHRRFMEWAEAGFFEALWHAGLAAYAEMDGIQWERQCIDGAITKAPLGGEATGPSPVDRGKKRRQAAPHHRWRWTPVSHRRVRRQSAG
jgi:transposase